MLFQYEKTLVKKGTASESNDPDHRQYSSMKINSPYSKLDYEQDYTHAIRNLSTIREI